MTRRSVPALVTPELLRWARETLGLSIQTAAEGLGMAPHDLRAWERGDDRPTFSKLARLAHYYRRSPAAFFLPSPPREPDPPPDFRALSYQHAHSLSRGCLLAVRRARRLRRTVLELVETLPKFSPPRLNSRSDHEKQAEALRKWLGVEPSTQVRWRDEHEALRRWRAVLESRGSVVLQFPFPIEDARGFSLGQRPLPAIVLNRSDAASARIFTLFHECAHLALGESAVCLPSEAEPRGRPTERFCDRVSASFLVPRVELIADSKGAGELDIQFIGKLARRYKVSRAVIARRLFDLELIDRRRYDDFVRIVLAVASQRDRSDVRSGETTGQRALRERGSLVPAVLRRALDQGRMGASDVAEMLGVPVSELGSLFQALAD